MTGLPPLRLGLEPGYDGGRAGAWLLDLPGAFGWASTPEAAVSQSSTVAGWWREWLARHGEDWPLGTLGWPEVVEESATVADGERRRTAIFAADREPVAADVLETAIRRIGRARQDLLGLIDRLAIVDAAAGERTADEVLRHLASSEIWLGSRVDPEARCPVRTDEPDSRRLLAETRSWAIDNLRRLRERDPSAASVDGRGDPWTLGKVVRRYVYHSVDHLRELDHRLAVAEDRAARLRFGAERLAGIEPLVRLLLAVGWDRRAVEPERLGEAIGASRSMVGAWDGEELVGFARETGDGVFGGQISMVIVDPRWQGLGIATRLVRMLIDGRPQVRFTLAAAAGVDGLYRRLGFEPDPSAMVRPRQG